MFYAVEIFDSSGISIDNYLAAIIVAAIRIVGEYFKHQFLFIASYYRKLSAGIKRKN